MTDVPFSVLRLPAPLQNGECHHAIRACRSFPPPQQRTRSHRTQSGNTVPENRGWNLPSPDQDRRALLRLARVRSRGLAEKPGLLRSEEHTSELQSLMRKSYAVFCLKKKRKIALNEH